MNHLQFGLGVVALSLALAAPAAAQDAPPRQPPDEPRIVPPAAPLSPPPAPVQKGPAVMKFILPTNALVWIENLRMSSTGPLRLFQSPPLETDKTYIYKVKVSWPTQPGQPDFVLEQEVTVKAGQTTTVDYTPVAQARPSQPAPPVNQAGYVQPPPQQPQPPVQPPPNRLPARRQLPGRGGF